MIIGKQVSFFASIKYASNALQLAHVSCYGAWKVNQARLKQVVIVQFVDIGTFWRFNWHMCLATEREKCSTKNGGNRTICRHRHLLTVLHTRLCCYRAEPVFSGGEFGHVPTTCGRTYHNAAGGRFCHQDFEAITPNLLARTIETVEGGGIALVLLKSMKSLKQLYTLTMVSHC